VTNPEGFTLDAASNISSRTGPAATYSYDTSNRLTSDGTLSYVWSVSDRLTNRGPDTFGYDPLDRLTSSTVAAIARTYAYDGDGLLQSRTQGTATSFLRDPATAPSRLLQVAGDRFVYGLGPIYAVKADTSTVTFAQDGSQSVRAEVNAVGGVIASFRYRAYGQTAQTNGSSTPSYLGYAGQLLDQSGLYYLRARWYDPVSGRFASRDAQAGSPNRPGTLNLYHYAGANPVMNSDPSGTFCILGSVRGTATFGSPPPLIGTWLQASATFALGVGLCIDSAEGLTVGGFYSGGAFVKTPYFSASTQAGPTWALGAYAGVSPNFGSNNARRVSELKGPFDTAAIDTQWGSLEYAESGDISALTALSTHWRYESGGWCGWWSLHHHDRH
jgi:RHS repeat-associated protein